MTPPTEEEIGRYIAAAGARAWEVPGLPETVTHRDITTVGIIGAGTMGGGIAMNFASAGYPVKIVETTQEALDRGLGVVRGNYQRSADKGRFPQDEVEARMGRFDGRLALADLAECDLVIEAVFEDLDLKRRIFTELDRVMKPGAILATNTSALDIDAIAAMTTRPQDVIGLHFFSPANVMKLLEIVRAKHTADDVVATCMDLARRINKVATLVGVCPGFVGNRILFARQKQANKLVYRGVMPWDVDAALNAFGFKMGPFQMSDLAGLDIGWSKGAQTDNPIRDALCELDRRGQKTKAGFYDYDEARRPIPSEVTAGIIRDITGAEPATMSQAEIIEICIYPMINEAVKILEENKAQRPSDIDVVWLNGYGWPPDTGGPMFYGDMVGAKAVLDRMETLGAEDAEFAPADTLRQLATSGGAFTQIDTGGLKV
ncbi:3-hydroxyacyl-CoA dehydrogenase [Aestuariivita sp.]|jgi:3-hydroxyacyl-CoA dehydrogenase|uniref:3-hydroxyacyl-CoA dehydrogenase n=1 Tax=Aestuariivita sp. TaxID=1872407 RepID=UPI002172E0C2|nr:3-hydroxyacyl-CoA dehydrogenase [Aestuariivita sp.]MCE8009064.1 3-hydroxyacyl-CoA dehydrogenase [Aestuariivita sp.]